MLRKRRGSNSSIIRKSCSDSTCASALHRLNSETVGEIVRWINYDDVVRLKSVGNGRLSRLLSQPRVIKHLSLTDLSSEKALRGGIRSVRDYLSSNANTLVDQISIVSTSTKVGYSTGEFMRILPLHLTHLTLHFHFIITQSVLAQLPRCLVLLDLAATDAHITDATISDLPPNLTHLALRQFNNAHDDYDGRALLSDRCISLLPPSLIHLTLHYGHFLTDDALPDLPRGITHLGMGCCGRFTDVGVSYLPRDLKYLGLCCSPLLTNGCVRRLPPYLEHLYLNDSENITDESIFDLPRTLTHLELSHASLSDACVPDLPRGLKHWSIVASNRLSDLCVPDLPRSLESLSLFCTYDLTNASIRHLPRTLKRLVICRARKLTTACIPDLPPNLTYLDVRHNPSLRAYFAKHKPSMLPCSTRASSTNRACLYFLTWLMPPLAVLTFLGFGLASSLCS